MSRPASVGRLGSIPVKVGVGRRCGHALIGKDSVDDVVGTDTVRHLDAYRITRGGPFDVLIVDLH